MSRSAVWRPFTQHAVEPEPLLIARSEGAFFETAAGRKIFDGISSWWVTTHGHRHPAIMQAIRTASEQLDQIIFAGLTHEPAERLAQKLTALAPPGLDYVFYSDSGSTSVEVALKMALGYFVHRGEKRTKIIVMQHSYHGDTIGAMSVGERGVFNAPYDPLLFAVETIPFPTAGAEQATLDALERALADKSAAALIVEPLILGAGGMKIYAPKILARMREMVAASGALFIADEVMTGWGRTGTLFACEQAGVSPDILCTSKGLTGGAVPLAATLAKAEIFDAHYSLDRSRAFFHSSSYTANPIACAAGLANVGVWENEPAREQVAALCALQEAGLKTLEGDARFENHRRCGTIAALDLKVEGAGYLAEAGLKLRAFFLERDLFLRPLGNTIYVMPPYCATGADLDRVYKAIAEAPEAAA